MQRYSKTNAINALRSYANTIESHGSFARMSNGKDYNGVEIDRGTVDAARDLANRISSIPGKVLRKDFKDIVISTRDEYTTLPLNKDRFQVRNGCSQILRKGLDTAYFYGKFNFYTDTVFSIFSDLDW